jgi:hypothetical protein
VLAKFSKIPHYTPKQKLDAKSLKLFRSYVAQLKKQGVVSGVDARSARPGFVRSSGPRGGKKTLSQIINENHKLLTPQKNLPKSLHIRKFATKEKSLASLFKAIEKDDTLAAKIDAQKHKGERWGFRINGTDSLNLYADIQLLIDDAFRYVGIGPYGTADVFHKRSKSQNLFDKLILIRWNKDIPQWKKQRHIKKSHTHRTAKNRRAKR